MHGEKGRRDEALSRGTGQRLQQGKKNDAGEQVPKDIGDMVKPGAVVIDVGVNRVDDDSEKGYHLTGDVAFEEARDVASAITPVPGGVGPMTIASLLANTVVAAEARARGGPERACSRYLCGVAAGEPNCRRWWSAAAWLPLAAPWS